ncbi:NHL repeat-containing protein [Allorhodopirellula solitaria]|uniref:Virginiamycin B lyase n=1 Tax=Allorhodopirellula solitaria TaxID=2527987 RepID=A0A5C5XUK6_9BACT|nr:hypothetical protein [Allorhodopirellula solitaria]TWT65282.1 Virginiamycin B lyase [Allorhodopirellula solitaria]
MNPGSRPFVLSRRWFSVSFAAVTLCCLTARANSQQPEVIGGRDEAVPRPNTPGELHCPFGVQFDTEGRMWVVEYDGGRVLKRIADGTFETVAGASETGYVDGQGAAARFNKLHNLVIAPDGMIYLSEHLNHVIRSLDPKTGVVSTLAGTGEPGYAGDGGSLDQAQFNQPISIALSPNGESLLIADIQNRRVRELNLETRKLRTVAGNGKKGIPQDGSLATEAPLVDPRAVAFDPQGNAYIAERGGHALRIIRDGRIYTLAGTGKAGKQDGPALSATFNGPKHIETGLDGRVYLADDNNDLIRIYDPETEQVSTLNTSPYQLKRPHGVTWYQGDLYLSDSFHHRIIKLAAPSR